MENPRKVEGFLFVASTFTAQLKTGPHTTMDAAIELGKLAEVLQIEKREDYDLHQAYLLRKSIGERKAAGLTWFPLKVNETGYGLGSYPFMVVENPGEKHKHFFQSASPVQLFSAADGNEGQTLQGTIGYVDDSRMKITFFVDELPDWVDEGKIGVNLMFDSKTYDEMFKALNFFINVEKGRPKQLRDVLLGYSEAKFYRREKASLALLNESQNEALQTMLDAEDVAVVHGPPGTGKTTTLVEGIRLLAARDEQVLVCAPSNAAADHLTRSLAASGVRVVRIGNLAKIEEDASAHTLDALLQNDREFKQVKELKRRALDLRKMGGKYKRNFGREEAEQRKLIFKEAKEISREARELENALVSRILDQAQAITCTLIGATHDYIADRKFQTVVIDEAGQALEPACWVPIQKAEKVIMAGDPFQLPPTVKSQEAARKGLTETLLEKTIGRQKGTTLLRTQYRMNAQIMQFSNNEFYGGKLEAHGSVADWHIPEFPLAVEFVDTAGCGFEEQAGEDGDSRANPEEANLLRNHFNQNIGSVPNNYSVGIISPYRAQIDALETLFSDKKDVVVNTIDSFQGQEKDIIYISLVRSNDKGDIGFLKDYRRMNVAMTRARKKLVVVGDSGTLANDPFYARFISFTENTGAWQSAWQWMG